MGLKPHGATWSAEQRERVIPGCPGCLAPSALQAFPSAKRFSWFSMQKTIVGNCRNCLTVLFAACFVVLFALLFSKIVPKIFSNHWKTAEKFSNRWKIPAVFPTIGKKFSNHWKTWGSPVSYQIGQNPDAKVLGGGTFCR